MQTSLTTSVTMPSQQKSLDTVSNKVLYIALYDYMVNLDKHLNIHKGDQLYVLSYNKSQEWCEVQNATNGLIGWVPTSYIKPFNSLENYSW